MTMLRAAPRGTTTVADTSRWRWADDAACRGEDLDLFYGPDGERPPEREAREREALSFCFRCPVMRQCREAALRPNWTGQHGVQGGMTAEQRITHRRSRMRSKTTRSDRTRADKKASVGVARRLQALAAIGHGAAVISEMTGVSRAAVCAARSGSVPQLYQRTVDLVMEVYPRLVVMGPGGQAHRAVRLAVENSWAGPEAWTGVDMDDPDARPRETANAA